MPYLLNDTYSMARPDRLYGRAGDEVTIISDTGGGYLIVATEIGGKFPVLRREIDVLPPAWVARTERPAEVKKDVPAPPQPSSKPKAVEPAPVSKKAPPASPSQGSLF